MIIKLFAVGIGGFFGCICRFLIATLTINTLGYSPKFPLGTLIVNSLGCFIIGLLAAYFQNKHPGAAWVTPLLITGFLGGMTTFSSFSLETLNLFQTGMSSYALLNVALQVILGMIAVTFGFNIVQALMQ